MLPENITLDLEEFRLQVVNPTSSLRSVAGLPFGSNKTLRVSHETTKDGMINSAIIIDASTVELDPAALDAGDVSNDRVMVKFSYDPSKDTNHAAALTKSFGQVVALLDATNLPLVFNQEH